jgi:hypothetical protein
MNSVLDMASVFSVPDLKKTTSLRMPESLRQRLEAVRDIWTELAKAKGASAPAIKLIDNTHVIVALLERQVDEELAQFGGYADTDEKRAAQLKAVRESVKKSSK